MKKNLEILDYEDKKTQAGKRYVRFKTSEGWLSCFDSVSNEELKKYEGRIACVEVVESGEFKNIKKCLGAPQEGAGGVNLEVEEQVEVVKMPPINKSATMYASYAKDVFCALSEINNKEVEPKRKIDDVIQQSIEVVKAFKEAFE